MRRNTLRLILLLWTLAAIAFPGCAQLPKPVQETPPAKPRTTAPDVKPPATVPAAVTPAVKPPATVPAAKTPAEKPAASPADKLFAEGMTALQEGGHERALELFSEAWREKPGHAGVAREFDGALLALKKNGDAAYDQRKWEAAGKRWTGTLRFLSHPAANPRGYPFTRTEVRSKVDRLSAAMMEKALTAYRRGEITSAIADWRTILSYDPTHEEATRSLQTALKQLETLKKMPPGK